MTQRSKPQIQVVAGVLEDADGRVLVARRPANSFMAGFWEFPGGKLKPGESEQEALQRELNEELGVKVLAARRLIRVRHAYKDRDVTLSVWRVLGHEGAVENRDAQTLRWLSTETLRGIELLPADRPVVASLNLSDTYFITPADAQPGTEVLQQLAVALAKGARLVQLRMPGRDLSEFESFVGSAALACHEAGARMLVNGDPEKLADFAGRTGADGVHMPARFLGRTHARPVSGSLLLAASCHDEHEIAEAAAAGANFAVLGPVQPTASHFERRPMGWEEFARLANMATMPVFAIGGLNRDDLAQAWAAGGQGIAAITGLWPMSEAEGVRPKA